MTEAGLVAPATTAVLKDVAAERQRQDERWGEQNHPDGTGPQFGVVAEEMRKACDAAFSVGVGTWMDILTEEFYEACAESDPAALREELIQVAAVATAWAEAIDRRLATEVVAEVPEPQEVPC